MQHDIATNEATLTAHVSNAQIPHPIPAPDHRQDRVSTHADGDIRTGPTRRNSPGAAAAVASTQTRRVSLVRPPSPTRPVPRQALSR
eukprot:9494461-Pyramimonas_sp.AAC.1